MLNAVYKAYKESIAFISIFRGEELARQEADFLFHRDPYHWLHAIMLF